MGGPASDDDKTVALPTVLVVEDEVLVRMVIADHLRGCGYRVFEAGNGDEAIAMLNTEVHVDVLFTDVNMPGGLDGFGLARWVRRERPGMRIILTSGIGSALQDANELCADGPLIEKPYEYGEVDRRIRSLLGSPSSSS